MSEVDDLWMAEASHRANNFAQLAVLREELQRKMIPRAEDLTAEVMLNGLSEAYEELHRMGAEQRHGPCHGPLIRVVGGLITLFGLSPCKVRLRLEIDELHLEGRRRRALVLLTSELVVNAIKHAFKGRAQGNLLVVLRSHGMAELVVADDGIGIAPNCCEGQGTALSNGLCRILQGQIKRSALDPCGLYVSVSFPVAPTDDSKHKDLPDLS